MTKRITYCLFVLVVITTQLMLSSSVEASIIRFENWFILQEHNDSISEKEIDIANNDDSDYIYDWGNGQKTDKVPEIEMVRSSSDCSTTSTSYTLCEGENFTVTHGTPNCCDSDARLYYYNGYTGNGQYGSYGVDQYTSSVTNANPGTYTFYTRIRGANGTSYCYNSITVTVHDESTAPSSASASPGTICEGESTSLSRSGGSLGHGGSWEWYAGSCGGTHVGSGSSISVSPGSTTTYYVRAEGTCNTTNCASVTVTVNTESSAPSSASASDNPICPGESTTLSQSGGSLGTGASWEWYTGSCGGTHVGSGSPTVSPGSTTTYYVRAEGTCNTTSCESVTVTIDTESTTPSSIDAVVNP